MNVLIRHDSLAGFRRTRRCVILFASILFVFLSPGVFASGQIIAWGGSQSPTNVPASASNSIALSAGYYLGPSAIALKADGTVVSWNAAGNVAVPEGLSNVMEIASGYYGGGIALRTNGTVVGWGGVNLTVLRSFTNVVSLEKDDLGGTLLLADGSVARISFNGATYPAGLTNIVSLFPFNYGYIALRADGTFFVDNQGWLSVSPSNNVMGMAAGGYRAGQGLLLRRDRSLVAWGNSTNAPAGTNFMDVAASMWGKFVLRTDGTVSGWSSGFSTDPTTNVPPGLTNITVIDAGEQHVLALRMDRRFSPVTLSAAMDTTLLVVSSKGGSQWFGQTNVTYDGVHAAQSGFIGDGTASSMRLWTVGPAAVSFRWRTSSETNGDFLSFSAGGVVLTNISGETGWQECSVITPPGNQLLQWTYSKDGAGTAGEDAAWVDQVVVAPATPSITSQPLSAHALGGSNVTLFVSATGTAPLRYQWQKDGVALAGITNISLTLTQLTRSNSGTYRVTVTNAAGSAISSNAVLKVHVPQRLSVALQPNGTMQIYSADSDGGQALTPADVPNFRAYISSNLVEWTPVPEALMLENGRLELRDSSNSAMRFYLILESW